MFPPLSILCWNNCSSHSATAWFVSLFQAQLWGLVIMLPIVGRFILFKIGTRTKAIQSQFLAAWVKLHLLTLSRKCQVGAEPLPGWGREVSLAGQPEFSPRAWAAAGNGFSLGAPSLRVVVSASLSTASALEISKSLLQQGWDVVLGWK